MTELLHTTSPVTLPPEVRDWTSRSHGLFIGGRWADAVSGRTFETRDPATGRVLCEVSRAQATDVDLAVRAARTAYEGEWSLWTPAQRQRLLYRLGEAVYAHAEELALLECLDNGKSAGVAQAVDVTWAAELFLYYAGWATKIEGRTVPVSLPWAPGTQWHAYTLREPVGVCGAIIAWTFPLLMAATKVSAALTCGNTVVLKPAKETPLTALRLAEIAAECGLPAGVLNVVPGAGDAGAALAAHPDVDLVAFTGSPDVGRQVVAAATRNLKRVSLELGGTSPQVVFADADVDAAVQGTASGFLFNHGQACTSGSRLLVEDAIFDDVAQGVAEVAAASRVGPGLDPTTDVGPLVSHARLDRVLGHVHRSVGNGARVLTGGTRHGDTGYFVAPTVLVGPLPSAAGGPEEVCGPVVVVSRFDAEQGPVVAANQAAHGMAASVWTRDVAKAHRTARLRAGTVWVNAHHGFDAALPFGGYRGAGWGRELGGAAIDVYTEQKSVNVLLS